MQELQRLSRSKRAKVTEGKNFDSCWITAVDHRPHDQEVMGSGLPMIFLEIGCLVILLGASKLGRLRMGKMREDDLTQTERKV